MVLKKFTCSTLLCPQYNKTIVQDCRRAIPDDITQGFLKPNMSTTDADDAKNAQENYMNTGTVFWIAPIVVCNGCGRPTTMSVTPNQ